MSALQSVLRTMKEELRLEPTEVKPLSIQAWNSHYSLTLEGRRQHLVIYTLPDPSAINGLLFEHKLLRFLQGSRFPYLPHLLVVNKESMFSFEGGWFSVTAWIEGCRQEDDAPLSTAQISSMAKGLSELHRCMSQADMTLDYHPDHTFVYPLPAFMGQREALIQRLKENMKGEAFDDGAREAFRKVADRTRYFFENFPLGTYWEHVQERPVRVVHGDFRGMNAAFDGDELTHILDFNCCFNEIRLWDVVYTALGLGGKETIGLLSDTERPARFLAEYHRASPLSRLERQLLSPMMAFITAKLMIGAWASSWVTDRTKMLIDLLDGAGDEIVERARLTP